MTPFIHAFPWGKSMRESEDKPVTVSRPLRDFLIAAAITLGGMLMLGGSIYGVVLQPGGPDELGEIWPLYLGGVVAILLGWLSGDLHS